MNTLDSKNYIADLDDQSVFAALTGDTRSFSIIVTHYEKRVFGFLGRMGFDQSTAADLAQDTFVRAWQHRARFDKQRGSFTAWLFAIARNVALTEFRRAARRPTDRGNIGELENLSARDDASHLTEDSQKREQLNLALRKLAEADRTAIALSYVEGLDAPEAAALLGCRADTYRARLSRARKRLAKALETSL